MKCSQINTNINSPVAQAVPSKIPPFNMSAVSRPSIGIGQPHVLTLTTTSLVGVRNLFSYALPVTFKNNMNDATNIVNIAVLRWSRKRSRAAIGGFSAALVMLHRLTTRPKVNTASTSISVLAVSENSIQCSLMECQTFS